ncbi:MAG: hypothetical protein JAY67_19035 [Candidatus Thiodiazotropha taylori]|nr:hypothetical protein [Candidatus Thiodiazotropha taylori]
MRDFFKQVMAAVMAGAILAGGGYVIGKSTGEDVGVQKERARLEQMFENAPKSYTKHLDEMINEKTNDDPQKILIKARAIVSTRDDLRSTLTSLNALLNSEIDKLAQQIESSESQRRGGDGWNPRELEETIEVLKRKWPSKMDQVDIEVRKLLAELGLVIKKSE